MPNCVRCPRNRACPNRRSVQGPRRLRKTQVLQLSQNCSSPTKKWRNICALTLRNCSTTCSTRPAISCTTVSPCPTAGTKHKAPKSGKTRPNGPSFRARSIPHERRLLEASVLLPTASRLHPHPRTSVFAHISLIYGRFQELTRGISLIYIYMALVLVGKAISGVKYTL